MWTAHAVFVLVSKSSAKKRHLLRSFSWIIADMDRLVLLFVVLLVAATVNGVDLTVKKQDLPLKVDATSRTLFAPFPGGLCKAEVKPISSPITATAVACSDVKQVIPPTGGPFANTTCFSITSVVAANAQLKISCGDPNFESVISQSVRVTIVDAPPQCRNYTVAVSKGKSSRFFLLASDPDDSFIQYHIRDASITTMKGSMRYCSKCSSDASGSPDIPSNWEDFLAVYNDSRLTAFSRMFSYQPPADAAEGFNETILFSALDISSQECPTDGRVTFVLENVVAPVVVPIPEKTIFVGRPEIIKIEATTDTQAVRFSLKSIPPPTCVLLCRISEPARKTLRDFPGEDLSGQVLEPCTPGNALKDNDDITLVSSKDTFFKRTFITVKAVSDCSNAVASFKVIASVDSVDSPSVQVDLRSVETNQRCIAFDRVITPSEATRFTVDKFVAASGDLTLTTLTSAADFNLQLNGLKLSSTQATSTSELVFSSAKSVDVSVMVEAARPAWIGYCKLQFRIPSSPSQTNSPPPTPTSNVTIAPTATPVGTAAPSSTTTTLVSGNTVLLIACVAVVAVIYMKRDNVVKLFRGSSVPQSVPSRRYGVVSSAEADD